MTKEKLLELFNEGRISPDEYSLGYEVKNFAINIHTLPNGKYHVFGLDERGRKRIIKTDIDTVEEAYDVVYNAFKVLIDQRRELYSRRNKDS